MVVKCPSYSQRGSDQRAEPHRFCRPKIQPQPAAVGLGTSKVCFYPLVSASLYAIEKAPKSFDVKLQPLQRLKEPWQMRYSEFNLTTMGFLNIQQYYLPAFLRSRANYLHCSYT